MQVKDGSWYQIRDKRIVKCDLESSIGWCQLMQLDGTHAGTVWMHSGRAERNGVIESACDLIREVSDPTKPLQLRVGGRYLRADGSEREIKKNESRRYQFRSAENEGYLANGRWDLYGPHENDLICEILDPAPEPELVLVAGKDYETKDGRKAHCVGENPFAEDPNFPMVVAIRGYGACFQFRRNGTYGNGDLTDLDIIRPWIDPPTEFVASNGKRYQVGPEIK